MALAGLASHKSSFWRQKRIFNRTHGACATGTVARTLEGEVSTRQMYSNRIFLGSGHICSNGPKADQGDICSVEVRNSNHGIDGCNLLSTLCSYFLTCNHAGAQWSLHRTVYRKLLTCSSRFLSHHVWRGAGSEKWKSLKCGPCSQRYIVCSTVTRGTINCSVPLAKNK